MDRKLKSMLDIAIIKAADKVCQTGFGEGQALETTLTHFSLDHYIGSQMSIEGQELGFWVFILTDVHGCRTLANEYIKRNSLGIDDLMPSIDHSDAVGEILNIFGGVLCRELESFDSQLNLGIPMFLEGEPIIPLENDIFSLKYKVMEREIDFAVSLYNLVKNK